MTKVHLGWAASQAVHVWRVAGYSAREISAGMRVTHPSVREELKGTAKKARRALEELSCWAGYIHVDAVAKAIGRPLTGAEIRQAMPMLAAGTSVSDVASHLLPVLKLLRQAGAGADAVADSIGAAR